MTTRYAVDAETGEVADLGRAYQAPTLPGFDGPPLMTRPMLIAALGTVTREIHTTSRHLAALKREAAGLLARLDKEDDSDE